MTITETPDMGIGGTASGDDGERSAIYQLRADLETLASRIGTLAGAAAALGGATDHPETRGLCKMSFAAALALEGLERTADDLVRRAGVMYRQARQEGGAT